MWWGNFHRRTVFIWPVNLYKMTLSFGLSILPGTIKPVITEINAGLFNQCGAESVWWYSMKLISFNSLMWNGFTANLIRKRLINSPYCLWHMCKINLGSLLSNPCYSMCTDFSPASMAMGRKFSLGGMGHVAKGLNAQGGLYALLKSSMILPVESGIEYINRPAP